MINVTESELRSLVTETVARVLSEGRGIGDELRSAYDILSGIAESGYIPFSSQAPSSTEVEIRRNIEKAISCIGKAISLDASLR